MVLGGTLVSSALKPEVAAESAQSGDPVGRLPVALLAKNVIEPILAFTIPARQTHRLRRRRPRSWRTRAARSSGAMAVAFALYPTQMSDLMAVADADAIMPPKSTWLSRSSPTASSLTFSTDSRSIGRVRRQRTGKAWRRRDEALFSLSAPLRGAVGLKSSLNSGRRSASNARIDRRPAGDPRRRREKHGLIMKRTRGSPSGSGRARRRTHRRGLRRLAPCRAAGARQCASPFL